MTAGKHRRRTTRSGNKARPGEPHPTDKPGLAARQVATRLLGAVIDKKAQLDGLLDAEHGHPAFLALEPRDRALVRAIVQTALRHRVSIGGRIDQLLDRPLPAGARSLEHLLHVAAAQILHLEVPARAAVDLAVEQAHADPRNRRFAGLVNAICRKLADGHSPAGIAEAPAWFRDRLMALYGAEHALKIMARHAGRAPLDLTVKGDPQGWADRLGGIVLPTGTVRLAAEERPVTELPGFAEGQWWVQDAAAAIPARLLGDIAGLRVADLCAAPGGKTAQLALAGAKVTAVDISPNRLSRLSSNMARLGLEVETRCADLLAFEPDEPFDAILLDAPCSSTGTVRRHPDVPWTKGIDDVVKLAMVQADLLHRALEMLKPGGTLVFSNCSLDPLEGEDLAAAALADTPGLKRVPVEPAALPGLEAAITPLGEVRTTPAMLDLPAPFASGLDGFYAVVLRRS